MRLPYGELHSTVSISFIWQRFPFPGQSKHKIKNTPNNKWIAFQNVLKKTAHYVGFMKLFTVYIQCWF